VSDAPHRHPRDAHDEPPPILGTWKNLYRFVLIYLAALIVLFWLFTRHYAPGS
jgi:hypothetical protein